MKKLGLTGNVLKPKRKAAPETEKISDVFGMLKQPGRKALSIEEMNKIITKPNSKTNRMG